MLKQIISSKNAMIGSISIASALLLGYYFLSSKKKDQTKFQTKKDELEKLQLLLGEEKGLIYVSSISTITFYEGDITENNYVMQRTREIMKLNPWLAAELVYGKDKQNVTHLFARYAPVFEENSINQYYSEIIIDENITKENDPNSLALLKDPKLTWEEMNRIVTPLTVKSGNDCIGKPDEPLFKVTIIKIKENNKIEKSVLIFSLSHVLGDGHTFYHLYSYLDVQTKIESLIPTRNLEFPNNIDEIYGKKLQIYLQSPIFFISLIYNTFFCRKPTLNLYRVDLKEILKLKNELLLAAPQKANFLSTNDILTWWYFQLTNCSYGIMAINFRNRITNYHNYHAGNYEGMIFYCQDDFHLPQDIRHSLLQNNYRSNSNRIPSLYDTVQYKFTCVTNWSTFYKHLHFPTSKNNQNHHIQQIIHYPLYDLSNAVFKDMAIIFKANENELDVLSLARSTSLTNEEILRSSTFLKPM